MILTNIKKGLAATLAASLLAVSVSAPVNAATGTTNIGVTINEFVVLYYFDKISFSLTAADLVQHIDSNAAADPANSVEDLGEKILGSLSLTAGVVSGDAAISITDPTPGAIAVTIADAWAVSSVDDGSLSIAVSNAGGLVKGGEVITTTGVGTNTVIGTAGLNIQKGDIKFNMDISSVASGGEYVGAFIITVNNT